MWASPDNVIMLKLVSLNPCVDRRKQNEDTTEKQTAMKAFEWDKRFETGIGMVDSQHKHLVDLVNLAGDILLEDNATEEELQKLFGQLSDYTVYHFNEEESLMLANKLDARHVDAHKIQHAEFLKQVTMMWENRHVANNPAAMLHGFLSSWLTVHILGQDQEMARILERMKLGDSSDSAYEAEHMGDDRRISPLLDALQKLYALLSVQNRELVAANANLEAKVAERTHALEDASQQVLQNEKHASLGRMVAGFAHEINTPIGIALGAISQNEETIKHLNSLLKQDEVKEEDIVSHLDILVQADKLAVSNLSRAVNLVRSFKRTSIDQSSEHAREFDIRELIDDLLTTLHSQFKRTRIKIDINCPKGIVIPGVPGLLEQLLSNLLMNSLMHAFDQGQQAGIISVEVKQEPNYRIAICYTDNGAGMSAEVVEKAFEPFFTTARNKGGSGLGLYVCYDIVTNQLGGSISISSEKGKCSRFDIMFPIRMDNSHLTMLRNNCETNSDK
jgi:hemerythrin-like metal-binding protein